MGILSFRVMEFTCGLVYRSPVCRRRRRRYVKYEFVIILSFLLLLFSHIPDLTLHTIQFNEEANFLYLISPCLASSQPDSVCDCKILSGTIVSRNISSTCRYVCGSSNSGNGYSSISSYLISNELNQLLAIDQVFIRFSVHNVVIVH